MDKNKTIVTGKLLSVKAGRGLKPTNSPQFLKESIFAIKTAIKNNKTAANIPKAVISFGVALNFNFIISLPIFYYFLF